MSNFDFDDVIRTAQVIVNPEQSAKELFTLRAQNAELVELLRAALPRIHQSAANDAFCESARSALLAATGDQ